MTADPTDYLDSDELRRLTHLQIEKLLELGVKFTLDQYDCPLVLYKDAKHFFLLLGMPLPRGLPNSDNAQ
jgi:hypothetical protein